MLALLFSTEVYCIACTTLEAMLDITFSRSSRGAFEPAMNTAMLLWSRPKGDRSRKLKDALHRKALLAIEKPDSTAICSLETQTDSK